MTSDVLQTFPIRKKWPPPPAALAVQPVLVARSIRIRENPHQKGYVDNSEDSQNEQRSPYRQLRRGECSEKDQNREEDTMDYRRKTIDEVQVCIEELVPEELVCVAGREVMKHFIEDRPGQPL